MQEEIRKILKKHSVGVIIYKSQELIIDLESLTTKIRIKDLEEVKKILWDKYNFGEVSIYLDSKIERLGNETTG